MRIISGKSVVAIALLLVLLATSLPSCGGGAPSLPVQVELSFSDPPVLDKPVEVTATFSLVEVYEQDVAHDVTARIILPEGFEKIEGELEWQGDIFRGNTYTLNVTVKAVKTGDWEIEARADFSPREGSYLGGSTVLYVSVSETGATVSDRPPGGGGISPAVPVDPLDEPIMIDFSISHAPLLNEPAELALTLSPRDDMPSITARIILPEGAALVDGNLEWQGDLEADVPVTLSAQIVFNKTGNWRIEGGYWQWVGEENSWSITRPWGITRPIYLIIGVNHSEFGEPPPIPIEPWQIPSPPPPP